MDAKVIREDLKEIKYYYSRKDFFNESIPVVGASSVLKKVEMYNEAICMAPPRLYDLYVSIYFNNETQDSMARKLGYSVEYMSVLHTQLVNYFMQNLKVEEK